MRATAHCFISGIKIEPLPIRFKMGDVDVSVYGNINKPGEEGKELTLEVSCVVDPSSLDPKSEVRDPDGYFIEKRLRYFKTLINQAAHLIEGLICINYHSVRPEFETDKVIVNIVPETPEEKAMIEKGEITGGFGDIFTPPQKFILSWPSHLLGDIDETLEHTPALSFISQGSRLHSRGAEEVAFILFFRIIEGYFGDGSANILGPLTSRWQEIEKYFPLKDRTRDAVIELMNILGLQSETSTGYQGFITDLVRIRNKIAHFDQTKASRHYHPSVRFCLKPINDSLLISCIVLLRDKTGIDKRKSSASSS